MSNIILVYCVCADKLEAENLARLAVERKHAACANILPPMQSFFHWEGKVQSEEEVPVLFKTTHKAKEGLYRAITQNHSYDVPAILDMAIEDGHAPFLEWVARQTK